MKRLLTFIVFVSLIFGKIDRCHASHIFGADLQYKWKSGYVYIVKLTLYADCGADASVLGQLDNATPNVAVYNNATKVNTLLLKPISIKVDVSPVCPKEINNTNC